MFIKLFYDNSNPGPVTPRRADAMPPTARRETTGSDRPARKQTGRQTGKKTADAAGTHTAAPYTP